MKLLPLITLALLLVAFVAVNIVATPLLSSARLDLTQARLFTLAEGSRNIAKGAAANGVAPEPVKLSFYFSARLAQGQPAIQQYGQRIRELLAEFQRASAGRLTVETIDPEPSSDAEDAAIEAGLQGVPTGGGDSLFMGLIATSAVGEKKVIPFFDPAAERFLEYEIAKLISQLSASAKPAIGVMSWLPVAGAPANPMRQGDRGSPAWQSIEQLKEFYDVRTIATDVSVIPDDIQVLLIIHPHDASDDTLFAIDQFALKGGRIIAFIDPRSEDMSDPMARFAPPAPSNLGPLLDAWGVAFDPAKVAADSTLGLPLPTQGGERVTFVNYLNIDARGLDRADAVIGRLSQIILGSAGALAPKPGSTATFTPVITTTADAALMDAALFTEQADPKVALAAFKPAGLKLTIAARLSGNVKTAFPSGSPAEAPTTDAAGPSPKGLTESQRPLNVLLIADSDLLADRFWLQQQTLGGMSLGYTTISDNGSLLLSSVDNLVGSQDLIALRARGEFSRPFTRVEAIRKRAEQDYLAQEQLLQQRLKQATDRISEIQAKRGEGSTLTLNAAQKAELDSFRADAVATRKELRDVQLKFRREIDALGTAIKFVNIAAVPALVALLAVFIGLVRSARRRVRAESTMKPPPPAHAA